MIDTPKDESIKNEELMDDRLMIELVKQWENKELYEQLMESFIDGKMNSQQFDDKFNRMWSKLIDSSPQDFAELQIKIQTLNLSNLNNLDKLEKFARLVGSLFVECDAFEPNSDLREDYEISEEELLDYTKKTLIESKKLSL